MESIIDLILQLRRGKHNVRFREVEKVPLKLGFRAEIEERNSHRVFSHSKLVHNITLVSHGRNDQLPWYQISDVIKALEELEENQ